MIFIWNDTKSFQRHLEAMRTFRQSHGANQPDGLIIKDMPALHESGLPPKERRITRLTDSRGKLILVPIWKIAAPPGSQN